MIGRFLELYELREWVANPIHRRNNKNKGDYCYYEQAGRIFYAEKMRRITNPNTYREKND